MVKPADLGDRDYATPGGRLNLPLDGAFLWRTGAVGGCGEGPGFRGRGQTDLGDDPKEGEKVREGGVGAFWE